MNVHQNLLEKKRDLFVQLWSKLSAIMPNDLSSAKLDLICFTD